MDFRLSQEQNAIFEMAKAFGEDNIATYAYQWDEDGSVPKSLWHELAKLGFGGLYVSEDAGGIGMLRLDATLVFEALSMSCASVAAWLSIHNMCASMIDRHGSDEIKERVLPNAITMKTMLAYCLTEPGSGSDAAALKTRAKRTDSGFTLNGTKAFISGGGYADAYIVMSRTNDEKTNGISAILVENGTSGLSFGGLERKMGWKSQPTRQVQLDDCFIPSNNLIGEEGQGFKYAMAALDGGRLNVSACSLGAAQSALSKTITYMNERTAFGKTIDQFQALQFRIADLETELQAARIFLRQAAWKLDNNSPDATNIARWQRHLLPKSARVSQISVFSFMVDMDIWQTMELRKLSAI